MVESGPRASGGALRIPSIEEVPAMVKGPIGSYWRRWEPTRKYPTCQEFVEAMVPKIVIQISSKLHTFRGEAQFTTWSFRIVHNACEDERRKVERELTIVEMPEHLKAASFDPDVKLLFEQRFGSLFQDDQKIALLYAATGNTAEVARQLNRPCTTVKSRLTRVIKPALEDVWKMLRIRSGR